MKTVAVCDAFMKESFYRKGAALHPRFELERVIGFGQPDRAEMRRIAYIIERGGPLAVPAPEELYESIAGAEALMVHLCPVTRRLIEKADSLRVIMVNRGGTENIDIAAATERGIAVLSNPAHNANAVAELTVGLMIAESRNIVRADCSMKSGGWRESFPDTGHIFELFGLDVGIIGFGSIGKRVARLLHAFGCRLMFCDPNVPADDSCALELGCAKVSLDELMSSCDYVSLHARADNVIIGSEQFSLMKPTAYFINTARPHLVDYRALYDVLRDRRILGAALDVHTCEPTDPGEPLLKLDNVTLTNHRGGDTVNSYADSPGMMFEEAEKLLDGRRDIAFWLNQKETEQNY